MSLLIGPSGALIDLCNVSAEQAVPEDTSSEVVTRGGVRQVWRRPVEPRTWSLDMGVARPRDLGPLQEMLAVTPGPLQLVTPWMQVTNMLTPDQAAFAWQTLPAGVTQGGAAHLADGTRAAVSAVNPTGAGWSLGATRPVPVAPLHRGQRRQVTAQVAVRSLPGTNATLALWFRTLAGTVINADLGWPVPAVSANTPDDGRHHVRTVTGPVPDTAVDVLVRLQGITHATRAAATMTPGPVDWMPGQGVALVDAPRHLPIDVIRAVPDPRSPLRFASSRIVLREVG